MNKQTSAPPKSMPRMPGALSPQDVPTEPTIIGRAAELLNHVDNLERENALLRGSLFGMCESNEPKRIEPSSLEGMLADACSRVACMVGDMATINGKVAR